MFRLWGEFVMNMLFMIWFFLYPFIIGVVVLYILYGLALLME